MFNAVQYDNVHIANDIADDAALVKDQIRENIDALRRVYFKAHEQLGKASYRSPREQTIDMRRLGQLADLIGKLEDAHSAAARCKCWID